MNPPPDEDKILMDLLRDSLVREISKAVHKVLGHKNFGTALIICTEAGALVRTQSEGPNWTEVYRKVMTDEPQDSFFIEPFNHTEH